MFCLSLKQILTVFVISFGVAISMAEDKSTDKPKEETKSTMQAEWFELQVRLQTLKARVGSKHNAVNTLIAAKGNEKDEQKAVSIVNDLKREHRDLQAAIREYEEVRAQLNYRFPEKGLTQERKYERIEAKSLEDMEVEFSLESKVKGAMVLIRKQYSPDSQVTQSREIASQPIKSLPANKKNEDPSRSSITEPQILQK